jgi:hypothetical protein
MLSRWMQVSYIEIDHTCFFLVLVKREISKGIIFKPQIRRDHRRILKWQAGKCVRGLTILACSRFLFTCLENHKAYEKVLLPIESAFRFSQHKFLRENIHYDGHVAKFSFKNYVWDTGRHACRYSCNMSVSSHRFFKKLERVNTLASLLSLKFHKNLKSFVLWYITPLSSSKVALHFSGTYRPQLQGRRINRARKHVTKRVLLLGLFFDHEDRGDMFLRNIG